MIRILLSILIFTAPNLVFGQERNCHCIDELDEVAKLIENAKSYKIQIKRKGRNSDFEKWKEKIKQEIINDPISDYFCTGYLQKYISFIRDRHNEVYFIPEEISACVPTYSKSIDTLQGVPMKFPGYIMPAQIKFWFIKKMTTPGTESPSNPMKRNGRKEKSGCGSIKPLKGILSFSNTI